MIRMLSGVLAPVIGGLAGMFKKGERVSAYRIVLAATLAVVGAGLWTGWTQWILLGGGIADGGFGTALGTFMARWAALAWLVSVLLWTAFTASEKDNLVVPAIGVSLFVAGVGTVVQTMYTKGAFTVAERMRYRATVSCEHCGASCCVNVRIGESWTDWESVECCRCGIKVPPETVPEYAESREAWDARVMEDCSDGTED